MSEDQDKSVASVVKQHLCHGCGSCVSACPAKAVRMVETPSGFLVPKIAEECNGCGLCRTVCPGEHLDPSLLEECGDPFTGRVRHAYLARSTDQQAFSAGQSGGAVTGLLGYLMRTEQCDGALVTGPVDATGRPKAFVARTEEELHAAQGSKYCPVALNSAICSEEYQSIQRPAVVGLPCHVHGIQSLLRVRGGTYSHPPLILGLICAGVYSFHLIDYLASAAGVAPSMFEGLRYRDKQAYGWPGDISVYTRAGGRVRVSARRRHIAKSAFRPPRCYLCFDQMNVLSDISFGDPWGMRSDRDGWTAILTRSQRGQTVLEDAVSAGALIVEPVEPDAILIGQTVNSRQRPDWTLATAVWRQMGFLAPDFGFSAAWHDKRNMRHAPAFRKRLSYSIAFFEAITRDEADAMSQCKIRRTRLRRTGGFPARVARAVLRRIRHKG